MPIELLRELANQSLPVSMNGQREVDLVRLLRSAGMVSAEISTVEAPPAATVKEITERGRITLVELACNASFSFEPKALF